MWLLETIRGDSSRKIRGCLKGLERLIQPLPSRWLPNEGSFTLLKSPLFFLCHPAQSG